MGSIHDPVVVDETSSSAPSSFDTPPPSHLSRHLTLGFDADDVAALITSIDSSQIRALSQPVHSFPYLPAEILLHILDHVPVSYVLEWRLVSRGFRDAIDGRVLYNCLHRTELIGYIGPRQGVLKQLTEEQYEAISLLRMQYSHSIVGYPAEASNAEQTAPRWSDTYAMFCNEDDWRQKLDHCANHSPFVAIVSVVEERLGLFPDNDELYGTLKWCIKLDDVVQDLGLPLERMTYCPNVDMVNTTVMVSWKQALFDCLKAETMLRKTMDKVSQKPLLAMLHKTSHTNDR